MNQVLSVLLIYVYARGGLQAREDYRWILLVSALQSKSIVCHKLISLFQSVALIIIYICQITICFPVFDTRWERPQSSGIFQPCQCFVEVLISILNI